MYRRLFFLIMIAHLSQRLRVFSFATSNAPRSLRSAARSSSFSNYIPSIVFQRRPLSGFFMSAADEEEKTLESTWNIPGLKKEAGRLTLRSHKKVGQASTRLSQANEVVQELLTNPDATDEELAACPDIRRLENDLQGWRDRLEKLNILEEKLESVKSGKRVVLPEEIASLALELGVNDAPPKRPERGPNKKKGPKNQAPRKPYFTYISNNNIEIRVGKGSKDNDELSCNPEHGDGPDWWMHAAGCPGSHVVIRCHDEQLDVDVKKDAAALAARQSKCQGNTVKVSLTRWRSVKKPPGAKPGLVQLTGKVETVTVNMKQAEARLQRLDETKI